MERREKELKGFFMLQIYVFLLINEKNFAKKNVGKFEIDTRLTSSKFSFDILSFCLSQRTGNRNFIMLKHPIPMMPLFRFPNKCSL